MTDQVRVLLVGDLFLGGELAELVDRREATWTSPFDDLVPLFSSADLRVANLEGPLSEPSTLRRKCNSLHTPVEAIQALKALELDAVSLANNHITDQGDEGVEVTRQLLSANGFRAFGAGMNLREAVDWPRVEIRGRLFSLLGYTVIGEDVGSMPASEGGVGTVPFSMERAEKDLVEARAREDLPIVSIHWGYQYDHFPSPDQIETGRRLIDAGALIVHGHHPHVLQGFEHYGRGVILYSMGNFFFPDFLRTDAVRFRFPRVAKQTAAALCTVGPAGVESTTFIPLVARSARRVERLQGRRAAAANRAHDARSQRLLEPGYTSFWRKHHEQTVRGRARQEQQISLAAQRHRLLEKLGSRNGARAVFRVRPRHVTEALRLAARHARLWTRPGDLR